jgi:cell wall-associated NlpC family hydrolase
MMAAKNGWSSYGDVDYCDHVLQYLNATPPTGQNTSVQIQKLLTIAQSYLSIKTTYVFGAGRNNFDIAAGVFDCSSWVREVFSQAGIDLGPMASTTTDTLAQQGTAVPPKADLKPGDLVFWNTYKFDGHVGIYLGNDMAIGCNTGKGVSLINMDDSYYAPILSTMRRIIN